VNRRPDWLAQQLPVGMVEDQFLVHFLRIFEDVAETVLQQVDNVPHLFDVTVAPDVMVRTIGAWLGLDWVDPSLPDRRQRHVVRGYSGALLERGTRQGLTEVLELVCGKGVEVSDSGGVYRAGKAPLRDPHVTIDVPSRGWATEADLIRIVRSELPASVTFDLSIAGRTIHPQPLIPAAVAEVAT
jgi:phage tail-like protein